MIKIVNNVASALDMVTSTAIRNSLKKLMSLPNSSMQNSDPLEETTNRDFIQQFSRMNITSTDDDIQNWVSCNGLGYEHMDKQAIVAMIFWRQQKKMWMRMLRTKMMFYNHQSVHSFMLKPCRKWMITIVVNQKSHQKVCHNLSDSVSFLLRNKKALSNKPPLFTFLARVLI